MNKIDPSILREINKTNKRIDKLEKKVQEALEDSKEVFRVFREHKEFIKQSSVSAVRLGIITLKDDSDGKKYRFGS